MSYNKRNTHINNMQPDGTDGITEGEDYGEEARRVMDELELTPPPVSAPPVNSIDNGEGTKDKWVEEMMGDATAKLEDSGVDGGGDLREILREALDEEFEKVRAAAGAKGGWSEATAKATSFLGQAKRIL